ncbi:MAG: hypothetical protein ABSG91_12760 [Syntrophobacteraceae bacterium]|jgi:Xaa-Pro aminopeptidase
MKFSSLRKTVKRSKNEFPEVGSLLIRNRWGWSFSDISPHVLRQRMIKEESEAQSIRKACSAIHSGHLAAASALRPGISELELAAAVENAQRIAGHEGCFFLRTSDFVMG